MAGQTAEGLSSCPVCSRETQQVCSGECCECGQSLLYCSDDCRKKAKAWLRFPEEDMGLVSGIRKLMLRIHFQQIKYRCLTSP